MTISYRCSRHITIGHYVSKTEVNVFNLCFSNRFLVAPCVTNLCGFSQEYAEKQHPAKFLINVFSIISWVTIMRATLDFQLMKLVKC